MKIIKRLLLLMFAGMLAIGLSLNVRAEAKPLSSAFETPKITVRLAPNGSDVNVTIGKAEGAEGFEVWVKGDVSYDNYYYQTPSYIRESGFKKYKNQKRNLGDYVKYYTLDKDGSKKRTVTLKQLPEGDITIKVRSYNTSRFPQKAWSEFSEEKEIKIKKEGTGYKTAYDFSKVKKGDIIKFGAFEQDNDMTNGKEVIEWIVLDKSKKDIFVLSKDALVTLPYDTKLRVEWENSTLRTWLNEEFYKSAFNKKEKSLIKTVVLDNDDNTVYNISGGEKTKDKIFILSLSDVTNPKYGFSKDINAKDENRKCAPSDYAREDNARATAVYKSKYGGDYTIQWWLRTPGNCSSYVMWVYQAGDIFTQGDNAWDGWHNAVRPAMYIKLE